MRRYIDPALSLWVKGMDKTATACAHDAVGPIVHVRVQKTMWNGKSRWTSVQWEGAASCQGRRGVVWSQESLPIFVWTG